MSLQGLSTSGSPPEQLLTVQPSTNDTCSDCRFIDIKAHLQCEELRWLASGAVFHLDHVPRDPSSAKCSLCRFISRCVQARLGEIQVERPEPRDILSTINLRGVTLTFPYNGRTRTFEGESTYSRVAKIQYGAAVIYALPLGADAFRLANRKDSYARLLSPIQADRNLILHWLRECRSKHLSCSKYDLEFHIPTKLPGLRLIDVHASCVVQATADMQEYLALSYVWGAVDHFVLKLDNIDQLFTPGAIDFFKSQLPEVVLDAISCTQDLGFRYLWVDALCICQDSVEEKKGRIAAMNLIYKGAIMTLVAAEAGNALSGLPGVKPYPKLREGIVERVGLMRLTRVSPPIDELLVNSKWMGRAWTYCEDQFSRRLLYFTKQQIYFRCLLYAHQEDLFEGDPDFYTGNGQRILHDFSGREYRFLQAFLADFSPRIYTFPTDRLDAFKSILTEMAERANYPFLEGIPTKDFFRALCWKHGGFCNRRNICHPSWTWAGWSGAISLTDNLPCLFPRIASVREHGPHGRCIWYTPSIAEEAAIQNDFNLPVQAFEETYSSAAINKLYAKLSLLDFEALLSNCNAGPWYRQYHRREQGGDDRSEMTEKILVRNFSRRFSDVTSTESTLHENLQPSDSQSRHTSSSTLAFPMEPLGCGTTSNLHNLVRLSFTALSICLPIFLLPSNQDGLVIGQPQHPQSNFEDPTIKFYFDTYTPNSAILAPAVATNMEFLLLSTDLAPYYRESERIFKESEEGRSSELRDRLTTSATSATRVLSTDLAAASSIRFEQLSSGYRSLASWMRSNPPPITMMVVEQTAEVGVYERIGIAEWDEHAFERCNPQAKHYLLT
jgi:Heterokaryon incompatibility protein (HET)